MKRLTLTPAATVLIVTRLIAAERFAIFDAATQKVKEKNSIALLQDNDTQLRAAVEYLAEIGD